jgi:signal transduction histidine kinase
VRLDEVIREVVRLVQGEANAHGVRILVDTQSGPVQVVGDRILLQQLILNLVMNGIEAIARGAGDERRVEVRTAWESAASARISVRDTGPGIEAARRERVFEAFYTTKDDGMGLGMGLPISRTIVQSHGGTIWCAAADGGGESVSFVLPVESAAP